MLCHLYYCFSVCLLIFCHAVVSLFSIYEFDCPFGIFCPSFSILWKNYLIGNHLTASFLYTQQIYLIGKTIFLLYVFRTTKLLYVFNAILSKVIVVFLIVFYIAPLKLIRRLIELSHFFSIFLYCVILFCDVTILRQIRVIICAC